MIAKTTNIVINGNNQGSELSEVMILGSEYDFWVAIYLNYIHNLGFLGLFYNFLDNKKTARRLVSHQRYQFLKKIYKKINTLIVIVVRIHLT